jgi:hypothetical protein
MNAYYDDDSIHSIWGTAVTVRNAGPATVNIDVEWFRADGTSMGLSTEPIISERVKVFWPDSGVNLTPFTGEGATASTGDLSGGWANVNADDPRVLASAAIVCRDVAGYDASNLGAMINVPAVPVGATLEYFQAGTPAVWTPPTVGPEAPQMP